MFERIVAPESVAGIICLSLILVVTAVPRLHDEPRSERRTFLTALQLFFRILFLSGILWLMNMDYAVGRIFGNAVLLDEILKMAMGFYLISRAVMLLNSGQTGFALPGKETPGHFSVLSGLPLAAEGAVVAYGMCDNTPQMVAGIFVSALVLVFFQKRVMAFIWRHRVMYTMALGFYLLIAVLVLIESVGGNSLKIPKTYLYFAVAFGFALQLAYIRLYGSRSLQ